MKRKILVCCWDLFNYLSSSHAEIKVKLKKKMLPVMMKVKAVEAVCCEAVHICIGEMQEGSF